MSLTDTYGDLVGKDGTSVQKQFNQAAQQHLQGTAPATPEPQAQPPVVPPVIPQNSQPPIDNGGQNPYIEPVTQNTPSVDAGASGGDDRVLSYFANTFGGDPAQLQPGSPLYNAIKSNMETQSAFSKLQNRVKQLEPLEQGFAKLEDVVTKNPALSAMLDQALQGKEVGNFATPTPEPVGKSTPSVSKPDAVPDFDENTLASAGLLDLSMKGNVTQMEWDRAVLNAQLRYAPKYIADQGFREYQTKLEQHESQRRQEQERTQLQAEWTRRYENSFLNAVSKGFDFTGNPDHQAILPEIEQEMIGLRDPKNLNLLREDAFEVAAEIVSRRRGIKPGPSTLARVAGQPNVQVQQTGNSGGREGAEPQLSAMEQMYNNIGQRGAKDISKRSQPYNR